MDKNASKEINKKINGSADVMEESRELKKRGYCNPCTVGAGAYADVYRVWRPEEKVFYACKVSREKKLWERECLFLSGLDHPLFPVYQEEWQEGGVCFLVMEYVPGEDLGKLLRRRGRMSEGQALRIGRRLAEGLVYLEELRDPVLFRDLKPENIRIREDGQVKLLDLGCACFADHAGAGLAGTPGYAAPEQLMGRGDAGTYSDVYGFGKLMHYMLTGDNPCLSPAIKPGIRAYNRKFSHSLEELVEKCVREYPEERFPDMRCVLRRIKDLAKEEEQSRIKKKGRNSHTVPRYGRMPDFLYEKNIFKSNVEVKTHYADT